jgi:hypothetical protein
MTVIGRRMLVSLLPTLVCPTLAAQIPARWSACRMDSLATWNCASYYTGTVSLTSELRGTGIHQTLRIVATVTGGRVQCRVSGTEAGDYQGPGMLTVEPEGAMDAGEYAINVWCPDAADQPVRRRDAPGIVILHQRAADYGVLQGTDAHEHPDTDEANGLAGTETITWELRRR